MKFFLDSAIVDEIEYALDVLNIDGVTTNPRHVQVSGKPFMTVIKEIATLVEGTEKTVSVEVNPHFMTYEEIIREARETGGNLTQFCYKNPMCGTRIQSYRSSGETGYPGQLHPDFLRHAGPSGDALRCLLCFALHRLEGFRTVRKSIVLSMTLSLFAITIYLRPRLS